MTHVVEAEAQTSEKQAPKKGLSTMSPGPRRSFGRGGSPEPFVVLPGEELPPVGVQATEGLWGMITLQGEPVAFVSPEIVANLPAERPVAAQFDNLSEAYVARFAAQPEDFFTKQLNRQVRGAVYILDQRFAVRTRGRIRVVGFNEADCDQGRILPIGEICDDECACDRRHQR